eukprot:3003302-Pleurochrysis_carterae.AAC.2
MFVRARDSVCAQAEERVAGLAWVCVCVRALVRQLLQARVDGCERGCVSACVHAGEARQYEVCAIPIGALKSFGRAPTSRDSNLTVPHKKHRLGRREGCGRVGAGRVRHLAVRDEEPLLLVRECDVLRRARQVLAPHELPSERIAHALLRRHERGMQHAKRGAQGRSVTLVLG